MKTFTNRAIAIGALALGVTLGAVDVSNAQNVGGGGGGGGGGQQAGPTTIGNTNFGLFGGSVSGVGNFGMNIPDVNITFDTVLNPGQGVGVLSPDALRIIESHKMAQQQVRYAINYLLTHRAQILAGEDELFNEHFGAYYADNPFIGQYQSQVPMVSLKSYPVFGLGDVDAATPYLITMGDTSAVSNAWISELKPGDQIYVGDPNFGTGQVATIQALQFDADFDNVEIILDPFRSGLGIREQTDATIWKVIDSGDLPNRDHFDRVLNTFINIRDLLDQDTEYRGAFRDFTAAYPGSTASVAGLDAFLGEPASRRLREAGYSNSDSLAHLQNLQQLAAGNGTLPLLWTDDNDSDGDGIPDEGSPFFRWMMTLFGEPDNPNIQNVADGFLTGETSFNDDFFSNDLPGDIKRDANGDPIANSATPKSQKSPLEQWQMIVKSFSESSTIFGSGNAAVIGLMKIQENFFPDGSPNFFEGQDADNYAKFAGLFGEGGQLPPALQEPFGKRGSAGFNPNVRADVPFLLIPAP